MADGGISHFDYHHHEMRQSANFIPKKDVVRIALTSGASCPDAVVDRVMQRILAFFPATRPIAEVTAKISP